MSPQSLRRTLSAGLAAALASLLPFAGAGSAAAARPGLLKTEFIYESAPFPECHASTIAESGDTLVCSWFGGTREKHPDVGIWVARVQDGRWTVPVEVANGVQTNGQRFPTWNPVLFQPSSGPLLLFYKVGPTPRDWWGMLTTSPDHGRTWTAPTRLQDGILGPIKNKPVELHDGTILCGSSTEHDGWRVHFEWTSDLGRSWGRTEPLNDGHSIGAIQPGIGYDGASGLQAWVRTRQGRIYTFQGQPDGRRWGPAMATVLPNPNSGLDVVRLRHDPRTLLIYNHTAKGRSPLNLAVTSNGTDWNAALVLEDEPGEYSYPAIMQTRDGLVHATWTWKRKRIRHAVMDPAQLATVPISHGRWP